MERVVVAGRDVSEMGRYGLVAVWAAGQEAQNNGAEVG